jgi:multidrug resistance efflux pump
MSDFGDQLIERGTAGSRPGWQTDGGSLSDRVRSLRLPADRPTGAGSSRTAWLAWLLCCLFAASTAALGYQAANRSESPSDTSPGERQIPASLLSNATAASAGEIATESQGYIIAAHLIQVSPKVSGMVMKLNFIEGKRVKKGDVLAQLETVDYEAERNHAKATVESARQRLLELTNGNRPEEIEEAKAELAEMEAQRQQLFLDWKRNTELKTGTALAQRDYEQAYAAYKAMDRRVERLRQALKVMIEGPRKERIAAADADLRQAEALLAKAEWQLDNCTVRAPVSGTVLSKKAEEGNVVNPIAFNISASLCEMADLSDLEVDLNIQEREIAKVFPGQPCRVRALAYPDRIYEGLVSRLMPQADRAKGAVPVRVKLNVPHEEEGLYLKPEMGATVTFLKQESSSTN